MEALEREWRVQQVAGELGRQADLLERHRHLVAKHTASDLPLDQPHQLATTAHQVRVLHWLLAYVQFDPLCATEGVRIALPRMPALLPSLALWSGDSTSRLLVQGWLHSWWGSLLRASALTVLAADTVTAAALGSNLYWFEPIVDATLQSPPQSR